MQQGVNMFKGERKIMFLKDDKYVVRKGKLRNTERETN